ncbi:hypothetical protein [Acidovorax sp. BLS4]|uniref:hypothetical protein n=1 Tax=Acidovorax sp. BLS4 TaxID=3273430 RepID=UPI002943A01F|nr:hypothetical protein [Paracidovorax avenae]WOI43759.1 hypothetical protein R1Z03_14560 [Paracidovorax avenae]
MSRINHTRRPAAQPIHAVKSGHYQGAELRPFQGRPGANQANALPSRVGRRLHHPDGRVTGLQGQPLEE